MIHKTTALCEAHAHTRCKGLIVQICECDCHVVPDPEDDRVDPIGDAS